MKTMKHIILLLATIFILSSCEKDEDKIFLSSIKSGELTASVDEVVLNKERDKDIVLSLAWTKDALQISDPNLKPIDVTIQKLQMSNTPDFSGEVVESVESSLSKAFTGITLNALVKKVGAVSDIENNIYFRLEAKTGNNMEPVYSNTILVTVTPYSVDMSIAFVLNAKREDTGNTLYSSTSDGVYKGFMGASSWYNYFLQEGNGTTWGNDAVDGSAFLLSSDEANQWNFWFPGQTGCYYVEVNTIEKLWTALFVPTLSVSGDIQGDMTFDRANVKWTMSFTVSSAKALSVKLQGAGKQYNYSTGTEDSNAIDTNVGFTSNGSNLALSNKSENISLSVAEAGDYTLVVDLKDPASWVCSIVKGGTDPVKVNPHVYLPGVDDGISENWTFDNYLTLFNEDDLAYAGVVNVNSKYGYGFFTEKDNWDDKYNFAEGDAYEGKLAVKGSDNIPSPTAGLYLIQTSLKNLTYSLLSVGSKIYISGLNDEWTFDVSLAATSTTGVYAGPITIKSASPWGFTIHLGDGDWDHKFGGSAGKLVYRGNNITDDASLSPGTYQMTVDLINGTYDITQ